MNYGWTGRYAGRRPCNSEVARRQGAVAIMRKTLSRTALTELGCAASTDSARLVRLDYSGGSVMGMGPRDIAGNPTSRGRYAGQARGAVRLRATARARLAAVRRSTPRGRFEDQATGPIYVSAKRTQICFAKMRAYEAIYQQLIDFDVAKEVGFVFWVLQGSTPVCLRWSRPTSNCVLRADPGRTFRCIACARRAYPEAAA